MEGRKNQTPTSILNSITLVQYTRARSREAMVKPHRKIIDPTQRQESDFRILSKTIRKTLIDELKNSRYLSMDSGSPEDTSP